MHPNVPKSLVVEKLLVRCTAQANRDEAIRDAAILAFQQQTPVSLLANDHRYEIDPHVIASQITRAGKLED